MGIRTDNKTESTSIELAKGIRQPGKMVFVLHSSIHEMSWESNEFWCLYEILVCLQIGVQSCCKFHVLLKCWICMFDRQQFEDGKIRKRIPWNELERYRALPSVDMLHAEATVPSDKQ